jgi:hypothetical protein
MREAGKRAVVLQKVPSGEFKMERGEARRVREVMTPKYVPAPLIA